jgi:hypothetical protein
MKQIVKTIFKLYDPKIIIGFLVLFAVCNIRIFQLFPDFCGFSQITSPQSFLTTLWTVVVGSSSIILTILLVVYSSYSKKLKRNSLDFILDNPWIKIVFSLFGGSFIYLSLSFITLRISPNATLTLIYISSLITVFIILIQFPLIVLSLKYSDSNKRIRKLINEINQDDVNDLYSPINDLDGFDFVEHMEKNKIILLKDIGIYAIKENDWGLPQSILNGLFEVLIKPLNKNSGSKDLSINLFAFYFVSNHFKNQAIADSDEITTKVILSLLIGSHKHLAENSIRKIRRNLIDYCIKDLLRLIIDCDNFYNVQSYLLRDCITIIKTQIESINYTDEELPTIEFNLDNIQEGKERLEKSDELSDYWFYITNELPDIIFNCLKHAIEVGNKNVYLYFNWQMHSLLDVVYNSKNLTEYQKNDAFDHYFYGAKKICDLALRNGIYDNIDIVSNSQIETWLFNDREKAFRSLNYFSELITRLNTLQKLSTLYIDDFFLIARSLSSKKMNPVTKQTAIRIILVKGLLIFEEKHTASNIKMELIRQLKWLNSYLIDENDLLDLKNEYSLKIEYLVQSNNSFAGLGI